MVIDIRGETVESTAAARLLMGQKVVVLDPYDVTQGRWGRDSFNPLSNLNPDSMRFEADVQRIAKALMFDPEGRSSKEPIWDTSTMQMFNGFLTYLLCYFPKQHQNLSSLANLYLLSGTQRENVIQDLQNKVESDPSTMPTVRLLYSLLTESAQNTKITANALTQGRMSLMWATNRAFTSILSKSSFNIDKLQTEPTTIYIVVPEEYIDDCAIWVRILFEAIFSSLKEVTDLFGVSSRELPQSNRVLFLMDEFPAFGQLETVQRNTNVIRGRGANLWLFMQHIEQLEAIYGPHHARTIVNNSAALMAFGSHEIHELEYLSRVVGEEMFDIKTIQMGVSETKGGSKSSGTSYTVTNSDSTSEGESRSSSVSKGKSRGGSTSKTRGSQNSKGSQTSNQKSTNSGHSGPYGGSMGFSLWPTWEQSNEGRSKGRAFSRNLSQAFNKSLTKSKNWGKSTTKTTGRTNSTTHTTGRSYAEGQSNNYTDSWSTTQNFSVSAKPEQLKIATARSLQRSISGQNQLLKLRGHYAFVCPRMNYLSVNPSTGLYRFPDFTLLVGQLTLTSLWKQIKSFTTIEQELTANLPMPAENNFYGNFYKDAHHFLHNVKLLRHCALSVLQYDYYDHTEFTTLFEIFLSRVAQRTGQSFNFPILPEGELKTDHYNDILSLPIFNEQELAQAERATNSIQTQDGIEITKWLSDLYYRSLSDLQYSVIEAVKFSESRKAYYKQLDELARQVDSDFRSLLISAIRSRNQQ